MGLSIHTTDLGVNMSRYAPLQEYLQSNLGECVALTFTEIEEIIGAPLPRSARVHRPWWSNNLRNSTITRAWRNAGYKSERVDMARETLVFRREAERAYPTHESGGAIAELRDSGAATYGASLYGSMKGMITVADDCDLTAPTDAHWDARGDDA